MPNATSSAILDNARVALPGAADDAILQALFNTCDDLAREALRVAPPTNVDGDPATWLPSAEWVPNYQTLLAGTLAMLYGQPNKPYYNPDFSKFYLDRYVSYRASSRATSAGATAAVDTIPERIVSNVRTQIPLIRDEAVTLTLYGVVNSLRVEAFRQAALTGISNDPTTWLTATEYQQAYLAVLYGTLSRLYGQSNTLWYNVDQQKAHAELYTQEFNSLRAAVAGTTTAVDTISERLVSAVRAQIPLVRDEATKLVIFDVVNDVRDELRVPPLATDALFEVWLTDTQWTQSYQAVLHGTLSRLYNQVGTAWFSLDSYKAEDEIYQQELYALRTHTAGSGIDDIFARIVSTVRAQIPIIRDVATSLAMFDIVNDIRDEAYRLPQLTTDADPVDWLTEAQWQAAYRSALHGTLSVLYAQVGTPWLNPDLAKAEDEIYQREMHALRAHTAGTGTADIFARIISTIRAQIPLIRDAVTSLAAFGVVNDIRDEAYRLPTLMTDADPVDWLTEGQWQSSYQSILHGTLSILYGQVGTPWLNPDLAKVEDAIYQQEMFALRVHIAGTGTSTDTIFARIISTVRAQIPLIRDTATSLVLFDVVNNVRAEAYRYVPLTTANTDPATWLNTVEYERSYMALLHGALSRLYGQVGTSWLNLDLSKAEFELYQRELQQIRVFEAGSEAAADNLSKRIVSEVRAQIPLARDEAIKLELYAAVDCIRREALRIGGLTSTLSDPNTWLTAAQWTQCYQAALHGTLYRMFLQAGSPWYSDPAYQAHYAYYNKELLQVRAEEAGSSAATDTIVERLISSLRAEIPIARDEALKLAMFGAVDRLRAEVYRLTPLTGSNTDPAGWFTADQYAQAFLAIQHGTLYRLYAQAGQPWFSSEMSQAQLALFQTELISLRMVLAGAVTAVDTIPERIVSTVRAQIQLVRDEAVKLEMFNVVNKIRLEAYGSDALKGVDTDYTTWLTEVQYEESYLAILHGTLCGLYGQSNMPWYNLDLYKAQLVLYQLELDLVRNENIDVTGGLDSLIEEVKPHLPGARDEVLWIELRRCVDEFLKTTQVWEEDIKVKIRPTSTIYEITSESNASIVRLLWVNNSSLLPVRASMLNIPWLVLERAPDVKDTFIVTVSLTLQNSGCCSSCGKTCTSCSCGNSLGFPNWIFDRWHEAFFDGLIGRMMLQPGKPYSGTILTTGGRIASDPTSYHLKRFRSAMAEARSAARSQNIYAGQRWRYPAFA